MDAAPVPHRIARLPAEAPTNRRATERLAASLAAPRPELLEAPRQVGRAKAKADLLGVLFWAMHANPFYSSVVRVQTERGHHTVAAGPYRFVRHPGYAATLIAMLSGGVALGSWLAMLPILVFFGLFVRRTLLEDRLLLQELAGYAEYAQKVRYRFVVGLF